MSYMRYAKKDNKPKWEIHPVWRGVGLIILIAIPILSYALARVFFRYAPLEWQSLFPAEAYRNFVIPYINYQLPFNLGQTVMTFIFMIILFGIFTVFYSMFMKAFGPSKYGPTDAPPIRRKVRKSR